MMKEPCRKLALAVASLALACFLIPACDSGGGGGDSSSGLEYTGETSQALVDESNAEDLSAGAYSGTQQTGDLAFSASGEKQGETTFWRRKVSDVLSSAAEQMSDLESPAPAASGVTQSEVIQGDCSGSAEYTITYDNSTGDFSGSIAFDSYSNDCDSGATIDGDADFSGQVDTESGSSGGFNELRYSFDTLSAVSEQESITLSGNIGFVFSGSLTTCSMDLKLRDDNLDKVFWARDLKIEVQENPSNSTVAITGGRYYHPEHGFCELYTDPAFVIPDGQEYPVQGVLIALGDDGTKARLAAQTDGTYIVQADANGNGTYGWTSGSRTWN